MYKFRFGIHIGVMMTVWGLLLVASSTVVHAAVVDNKMVIEQPLLVPQFQSSPTTINLEGTFSSYMFKWTAGANFEYSWDNKNYLRAVLSHDLGVSAGLVYSSIVFKPPGNHLYVRNSSAAQISILLLKPELGQVQGASVQNTPDQFSGASYFSFDIVTREEWGANPIYHRREELYHKTDKIIIHHTAWPNNPDNYAQTLREIYYFHAQGRDWGDIGYNYLIDPNGQIYEGRAGGESVIGIHTGLVNAGGVGIAFLGDFSNSVPTQAAQDSFTRLAGEIAAKNGFTLQWGRTVFGHRNFTVTNTVCPGQALYTLAHQLIRDAEDIRKSSSLAAQRAAYLAATQAVTTYDAQLQLEFQDPNISEQAIRTFLPPDSGLVEVDIAPPQVRLRIESFNYYNNVLYDNTRDHVRLLYTLFKLMPQIKTVEVITPTPITASDWVTDSEVVSATLSSTAFAGRVYQFSSQSSAPFRLLMRTSSDGVFDGSASTENWQPHPIGGKTKLPATTTVFNNTLVVSIVGLAGDIWNTALTDAGWQPWSTSTGKTDAVVAAATINIEGQQRLYQIIKQAESEKLAMRYTTDGVFNDASPQEAWTPIAGKTRHAPALASFQNQLVFTHVGKNDRLFTLFSPDGNFPTTQAKMSEMFILKGTTVALAQHNNRLYQAIAGYGRGAVMIRSTADGVTWTNWYGLRGRSAITPQLVPLNGRLIQFIKDTATNFMHYRYLDET